MRAMHRGIFHDTAGTRKPLNTTRSIVREGDEERIDCDGWSCRSIIGEMNLFTLFRKQQFYDGMKESACETRAREETSMNREEHAERVTLEGVLGEHSA